MSKEKEPKPMPTPYNTANLTPHDIVLVGEDGQKTIFPAMGITIRLEEQNMTSCVPGAVAKKYTSPKLAYSVSYDDSEYFHNFLDGRFISYHKEEDIDNLSVRGVYEYVIVSGMVLEAISEAYPDQIFLAPDTGIGAVRNEKGQIIGTKNWVVSQKFANK